MSFNVNQLMKQAKIRLDSIEERFNELDKYTTLHRVMVSVNRSVVCEMFYFEEDISAIDFVEKVSNVVASIVFATNGFTVAGGNLISTRGGIGITCDEIEELLYHNATIENLWFRMNSDLEPDERLAVNKMYSKMVKERNDTFMG